MELTRRGGLGKTALLRRGRGRGGKLERSFERSAGVDEVGLVQAKARGQGGVEVGEDVFEPATCVGDVLEETKEFGQVTDLEGFSTLVEGVEA